VQGKLSALGVHPPMLVSPREFDAFIENEIAANSDLVKAAGMKPN
jgi:tripartite-type tricarboxylate transporter receptor subunit TctC